MKGDMLVLLMAVLETLKRHELFAWFDLVKKRGLFARWQPVIVCLMDLRCKLWPKPWLLWASLAQSGRYQWLTLVIKVVEEHPWS